MGEHICVWYMWGSVSLPYALPSTTGLKGGDCYLPLLLELDLDLEYFQGCLKIRKQLILLFSILYPVPRN